MGKRFFSVTAGVLLVLIGICSAAAIANAQKQSNLAVTTTIADATFQLQSDGLGAYTNTKAVQSIIQSIGDWVLDTNYSSLSTRGVYLDFSQPVDGSAPGPDPVIGVKARLITQCATYGYSMTSLAYGQTAECGLVIGFDNGGSRYRLAMNPAGANHYLGTTTVSVSCIGVGTNGQCNQWSITGHNGGASIARLVQLTTVKGRTSESVVGDFYFSFAIGVTNP